MRRRLIDRVVRRLFPVAPDFHALIGDQCAVMVRALEALVAYMEGGGAEAAERVAAREHEGDVLRRRNVEILLGAFATPFDREAISDVVAALDDILNDAKATVREMATLGLAPDGAQRAMSAELLAGGRALAEGFALLRDDPGGAQAAARRAHNAERNVGKAYRLAVAERLSDEERLAALDAGGGGAERAAMAGLLEALRRREVYRHLSDAGDRLDVAGRALQAIAVAAV